MSGGHFDYKQYELGYIADDIEQMILNNDVKNEYGYAHNYSNATLKQFKKAVKLIRQAQVYAQRVDWLVSGDDGEDCFHRRLAEDLKAIK